MPEMQTRRPGPVPVADNATHLPRAFPKLPPEVLERFPNLAGYEERVEQFWAQSRGALQTNQQAISVTTTAAKQADQFLSGHYVLQVRDGNVVTGMEITSAVDENGGVTSDVTFQADRFKIYSGTTKQVIFEADAVQDKVRMAGVFTVDGATDSIYVKTTAGAGTYNAADTPFFVDDDGFFSLGSKLTWNPTTTTLTITGTIIATAGTIGGFEIGADYVRDVANSMGLASTAGAGQVRFWAGATFANRATAPFRVTEAGVLTATSGTVGGWTLSSTQLSGGNAILHASGYLVLGTSNDVVYLSAVDGTYRLWVGNATAGSAAFSVTKAGALFSNSGTIGGFTISTKLSAGSGSDYVEMNPDGDIGFIVGDLASGPYIQMLRSGGTPRLQLTTAGGTGVVTISEGGGNAFMTIINGAATITLQNGAITITGIMTAASYVGSGAALTALNATNLSSGTVPDARFPGTLPSSSAINLFDISASSINSGTLNNTYLPGTISQTDLVASNLIRGLNARFGTHSAIGAETLSGFITITDDGGTSRKLAVVS